MHTTESVAEFSVFGFRQLSLLVVRGNVGGTLRTAIRTAYLIGSSVICLTSHNLFVLHILSDTSVIYLHVLLCYTFDVSVTLFLFYILFCRPLI
jgi:hypothetical protein